MLLYKSIICNDKLLEYISLYKYVIIVLNVDFLILKLKDYVKR